MSIRLTRPCVYADLGEVWLGDQLARLAQRQAQFGGHYRADADALLHRLARTARVAKTMATPAAAFSAWQDRRQDRCRYIVETSLSICRGQLGLGPRVDQAKATQEMFARTAQPI